MVSSRKSAIMGLELVSQLWTHAVSAGVEVFKLEPAPNPLPFNNDHTKS